VVNIHLDDGFSLQSYGNWDGFLSFASDAFFLDSTRCWVLSVKFKVELLHASFHSLLLIVGLYQVKTGSFSYCVQQEQELDAFCKTTTTIVVIVQFEIECFEMAAKVPFLPLC
jgi:hypothetical protein